MTTAAVVLAGGASRRFGSDKTRAALGGVPLLERVLEVVVPMVDEVVVVGPWAPPGCRHAIEPERYQGPLAALAHGLGQVAAPYALVLAGDHPFLQRPLLELLLARRGMADAIVPTGPSGPEPLVGCYRTALAGPASRSVRRGERSIRSFLDTIDTEWVREQEWRQSDPGGLSFLDVDHQSDLSDMEHRSGPQP